MIVVDVGANKGELSKFLLERNKDVTIYAIEPNFLLFSESLNKIQSDFPENFTYLSRAISKNNGHAKLFAPEILGGHVGSLLPLNNFGSWGPESLKNLPESDTSHYIDVETSTAGEIVKILSLSQIDFLKIDTQGTDLDILEDFLAVCDIKVAAVEVEVSSIQSLTHYKDSDNGLMRLMKILQNHNYEIMRMMPVSGDCSEYNVFVAKTILDFESINKKLIFSAMPVFSRYWKVLGIGARDKEIRQLQVSLSKKILASLMHPKQSYRSMLIKLSS